MQNILRGIICSLLVALVASGLWVAATTASNQTSTNKITKAESISRSPIDNEQGPTLTFRELTQQAELIAVGQCASLKSAWSGRTLVTLATIDVSEVIKGQESSTVTVVLPGGIDANRKVPIAMTFPGAPRIMPQEQVVLFLEKHNKIADGHAVVGYSQGKFSIVEGAGGRQMVSPHSTKLTLQGRAGAVRGAGALIPLTQLKKEVESYQ